jgi:enoyl-CoA hydratase/carnithine racemase
VSIEASTNVTLHYETRHIAVITMHHQPVNTLSWSSRGRLKEILDDLDDNSDVRCVVIGGSGDAFTAGADLREDETMEDDAIKGFLGDFERILGGIENFRAPVIAVINGAAIGGGFELAMACDVRMASTNAFFVAAGVNVGLIANFWRLPRITGLGPAKEILLTGGRYSAEQALRWGLVTSVHEPAELLPAALEKAQRIATRAPLSVENTKECANIALGLDFDGAHQLQVERFLAMFNTEDHKEALRAFFEKREGNYRRR